MTNFIQSVDERTQLAGANRLEALLFSLGDDSLSGEDEIYGINVFKVREVMHIPRITKAPNMPKAVEGMISLRGQMIPVINLPEYCGITSEEKPRILIITEYNKHMQGFMVQSVESIERLAWADVKEPPPMISNRLGGLVTAVTEMKDGRIVMILDVEKVLSETADLQHDESIFDDMETREGTDWKVLFCDDSSVAREQVITTLKKIGVAYTACKNGQEAWNRLNEYQEKADESGKKLSDFVNMVITDVEMPEMDGYVLTKRVKEEPRFRHIPVVMHSSLSAEANMALGKDMGADYYVSKFEPKELAKVITGLMDKNKG